MRLIAERMVEAKLINVIDSTGALLPCRRHLMHIYGAIYIYDFRFWCICCASLFHSRFPSLKSMAPPKNTVTLVKSQDVVCPVAVKVDDLDAAVVSANYEAAKSKASAAEAGSADAAEAMIEVEVNKAMGAALGLTMA